MTPGSHGWHLVHAALDRGHDPLDDAEVRAWLARDVRSLHEFARLRQHLRTLAAGSPLAPHRTWNAAPARRRSSARTTLRALAAVAALALFVLSLVLPFGRRGSGSGPRPDLHPDAHALARSGNAASIGGNTSGNRSERQSPVVWYRASSTDGTSARGRAAGPAGARRLWHGPASIVTSTKTPNSGPDVVCWMRVAHEEHGAPRRPIAADTE